MLDAKHTLADLDEAMRHVAEAQKCVRTLQATIKRRRESGRPTEGRTAAPHAPGRRRQAEQRRRIVAQAILRGE